MDDLLLVYFAGHGVRAADGKPRLIAEDTRAYEVEKQAIAVADIEAWMKASDATRLIMMLVACHMGLGTVQRAVDSEFVRNVYELAEGFALLVASTAQQGAHELGGLGHGLFSYYVLKGLAGEALQPELGTSLVLVASALGMLYWSGTNPGWLILMISPLVSAIMFYVSQPGWIAWVILMGVVAYRSLPWWSIYSGIIAIVVNLMSGKLGSVMWGLLKDYQKDRLTLFLDPSKDPLGGGYLLIQSRIAIGSGEMWGRGLFQGTQTQLSFIPEQHTDFIFSAVGDELGFIGAHSYPHWFALPPDAPQWYPIYAKCCELDIPIMMQVGQNLIYQKDVRLPSVARPILLDQIAIDFPDLKLIGIHVGTPWADEMIAMAWKHQNVYIGIDAYAPKHLPATLIHYMNSYGSHKVLFGTDWPVIDPRRARRELDDYGLREEAMQRVLRDNALAVFPSLKQRMGAD